MAPETHDEKPSKGTAPQSSSGRAAEHPCDQPPVNRIVRTPTMASVFKEFTMKRAHRVSRRAALKASAVALSSLVIPRMVHAAWPRPQPHPTWDVLLNHIGTHGYPNDTGLRT